MATWSAPGKVFLFGEHAVVFGKPGVAMAIRPRVYVTVRRAKRTTDVKSPYLEECFCQMGVHGTLYVRSLLPSASGLGSSAAVTVATLCAINDEFGLGHTREEVSQLAFEIEKKVQKGRASPTDTYVSSFGGLVLIDPTTKRRLPPQNFPLVIGNTGISHNTSHMLEMVAAFRKASPEIALPLLDAIEGTTRKALHSLNNPKDLGNLMDVNHALLEALGVGHPVLSKLVLSARAAGAFGAKLTGAGGGGCMVALCPSRLRSRVAGAIKACDASPLITTIDTEGARKEKNV
ncbi:MAG: mevalonate kinase [Methanomicrobiales archaeon]|nr:mevalonate kinase [Methanomicrobiales archaeon]